MSQPALEFNCVTITYPNGMTAVRELSLLVAPGECLALVGESGCGKTTLARAALGLLPAGARITGSIRVGETEVVGAPAQVLRALRGRIAGFVAQDPFAACNPLSRVYDHVAEAWRAQGVRNEARQVLDLLTQLGIEDAAGRAQQYPHEWSGGMLQRAVIAAASAHHPPLVIADEPTSALDPERAAATLAALRRSAEASRAAVLLITHDLKLAAEQADRIAICQAGRIVAVGSATEIVNQPPYAYAAALRGAAAAAGSLVPRGFLAAGGATDVIVEAQQVSKIYTHGRRFVQAVVSADLRVRRGEIVGIRGPSGSGKSTFLRLLAGLESPSSGKVKLGNAGLAARSPRGGFVMPIFQDPVGSLDRRWPVWRTITEPLTARQRRQFGVPSVGERRRRAAERLAEVGLAGIDSAARPDELSVGQCQRVAIARALMAEPALIVADEPTSALDAANAVAILRLLAAAADRGTALLIISHDSTVLSTLSHRLLEMRDGILLHPKPGDVDPARSA